MIPLVLTALVAAGSELQTLAGVTLGRVALSTSFRANCRKICRKPTPARVRPATAGPTHKSMRSS